MSQKCITDKCQELSRALCKCCRKEFCLQHLREHIHLIVFQLNSLKTEIEEMDRRVKIVNIDKTMANFRQQMTQWRIDGYTTIDRLSERKYQEFNRYIYEKYKQQRKDIDRLQQRINGLVATEDGNRYDIDLIRSNIDDLKEGIGKVEQTPPSITILPLVVNEQLIRIDH